MTAARLSPRARRELLEAVDRIAEDNPKAADALIDAIEAAARRIGDHPLIGVARPHLLRAAFRFVPLSGFPFLVIYNDERNPPEIVAIIHGARDLPRLLQSLD